MKKSVIKSFVVAKNRRKTLRAQKKGFLDKVKEIEGDIYTAGGH